ncbi:MAG: thioredoxin-disulfide reductase [Alphaproteobacteria bacterium]|nr:MAG: thioredoxin-disulfide reductase [Alphaproteobacteria bacterium]
MKKTKCLIIGSGPAGYTAAVYAQRAALDPVLFLGNQPGGQLTITTEVENWPGDTSVQGPELMQRMADHCQALGVKMIQDQIIKVDLKNKTCESERSGSYQFETLIIATGAQAKWLGLDGEKTFQGYGVSGCATCDGFFFKDKKVCVVGGGNTAVEEATFLTKFASEVYLIHRRDTLKADKTNQERLLSNPKVKVLWNKELVEIDGDTTPSRKVKHIQLRDTQTGDLTDMSIDGVFVAIGHSPATSLFKGQLEMDEGGYLIAEPNSTKTSIPGVFAAGDVQDKVYRQAVTAAGQGCMAALEAERYLQCQENPEHETC